MKVIYKNLDNTVAVIIPVQKVITVVGAKALAEKDVPQGLPYWVVEDNDVPQDRTQRSQWVMDTDKEPDGFGGESNEFTDEQLTKLYKTGAI